MGDRIGGQLAREAPKRIREEAQRRRAEREQRKVTVTLTEAEARALLRFDMDPPPEWLSAETKLRAVLAGGKDQ